MRSFTVLLITRERLGLATWNFDSSLRLISCVFVPNFQAIALMTLILGHTAIKLWRKNRSHSETAQVRQKIFHLVVCLRYPFIPTNSLLTAMSFFPFFSSEILYAVLLKQKTLKSKFCVKLLSCKRNFVSWKFFGPLPQEHLQNGAPKNQFFKRLKLGRQFFWYQSLFIRQIFWRSWGVPPPRGPPNGFPKTLFWTV